MSYPFKAKTNKKTVLIRLWGNSITLQKNRRITVYDKDGPFATVSITTQDGEKFGSVPVADYNKA